MTSLNRRAALSGLPSCGLLLAFLKEAGPWFGKAPGWGCVAGPWLYLTACEDLSYRVLDATTSHGTAAHSGDFVRSFPLIVLLNQVLNNNIIIMTTIKISKNDKIIFGINPTLKYLCSYVPHLAFLNVSNSGWWRLRAGVWRQCGVWVRTLTYPLWATWLQTTSCHFWLSFFVSKKKETVKKALRLCWEDNMRKKIGWQFLWPLHWKPWNLSAQWALMQLVTLPAWGKMGERVLLRATQEAGRMGDSGLLAQCYFSAVLAKGRILPNLHPGCMLDFVLSSGTHEVAISFSE